MSQTSKPKRKADVYYVLLHWPYELAEAQGEDRSIWKLDVKTAPLTFAHRLFVVRPSFALEDHDKASDNHVCCLRVR
jgi:hypothetical protein